MEIQFLLMLWGIAEVVGLLVVTRILKTFHNLRFSKGRKTLLLKTALAYEFNQKNIQRDAVASVSLGVISAAVSSLANQRVLLIVALAYHFIWPFLERENNQAVGMAWGFYFGYLKKVVPKFIQNVSISDKRDGILEKLLILVPADCSIYNDLSKVDKRITYEENLHPTKENVGGIRARKYVNSCYKVDYDGGHFYAAIEYASPLNILREMCNHKKVEMSSTERDNQTIIFYETMKMIINDYSNADDPSIKDHIEFVFIDKDENVVDKLIETAKQIINKHDAYPKLK